MFGLSLNARGLVNPSGTSLSVTMRTVQVSDVFVYIYIRAKTDFILKIWYLAVALFILATTFTFLATRRPRGPQPVAYGHVQTLANLVDVWSPTMWWGHKGGGKPLCYAGARYRWTHAYQPLICVPLGTSDWPLPPPRMIAWYA